LQTPSCGSPSQGAPSGSHVRLPPHTSPSPQAPHEPPQPSGPQDAVAQSGSQGVQVPALLQDSPASQAPHAPPQPSGPQARPLQSGSHDPGGTQSMPPPEIVRHTRSPSHAPHEPPQPSGPQARPSHEGVQAEASLPETGGGDVSRVQDARRSAPAKSAQVRDLKGEIGIRTCR
jgi:hypothetical protein